MAFDAFLKIEGIDGESTDKTHKGEIEIQSFSWGVTQTGTGSAGGGGGAGKAVLQDIHFTSSVSKASPNLFLSCATGKHLPSALLTCRKAGGQQVEFLKIRIADCLVSSFQDGGDATADDLPTDQFSLNFARIEVIYTQPRTGEVVDVTFDGNPTGGQ